MAKVLAKVADEVGAKGNLTGGTYLTSFLVNTGLTALTFGVRVQS